MKGNPFDFSFSGIKTAVLYYLREHAELHAEIQARQAAVDRGEREAARLRPLCSDQTLGLLAEFQKAVVRDLVERTVKAAQESNAASILVSGGVAANSELRRTFERRGRETGLEVFFPSRALSTDNAAMIAAAAYPKFLAGIHADATLNAEASLPLA